MAKRKKQETRIMRVTMDKDEFSKFDIGETHSNKGLRSKEGKLSALPDIAPVSESDLPQKTVYRTRYVEKKPSVVGQIGLDLVSQYGPKVVKELWQEHKDVMAREELRKAREEQREIAAIKRDTLETQLEVEKLRANEREAAEKRQREARLTDDQRQVISLAKTLREAHNGFVQDMTKDEACRSLIRAFVYFVMFIMELQNIQQARIVDEETGEYIEGAEWFATLPWGEFLQDFNLLLKADPSLLQKSHAVLLSEAFGRDIIVEGDYLPITGEELTACLHRIT